ncbi:MAG: VWA domain-containing protein [Tepidisphaeraceae bacterium]
MVFGHPAFLWLLPLAVVLAYAGWRGARQQRIAAAVVHGLCIASVVLALAEPMLGVSRQEQLQVGVVEITPFVTDAAVADAVRELSKDAPDVRLIAFGNRAERVDNVADLLDGVQLAALRKRLAEPVWADDSEHGAPALATALQLAGGQVPAGGRGDVRLIGSGWSCARRCGRGSVSPGRAWHRGPRDGHGEYW